MDNISSLKIAVDSSEVKKATNDLNTLSNISYVATGSIGGLVGGFTKMKAGALAAAYGWAALAKAGIDYNAQIEKLTNGLTTLNVLTSKNVDSNGKAITLEQKYNIARRESIETMQKLNAINLETPHTLDQTVQIYKAMYTSMRTVGVSSEQMIDLTKKLSIAAGSSGIEFQQLLSGIDGLATGTVEVSSELGRFLKSIGLTNEELKKSSNIYETINNKVKDVKGIIGYDEAVSNLSNSFEQLTGALVEPFFDDVKSGITGLAGMFNDLTKSVTLFYDKFKSISELSTKDQLNTRAVEVATKIAEQKERLANAFDFNKGKYAAELRASELELLAINQQFEAMNKLNDVKTVANGIERNQAEITKISGSELAKFNLSLDENIQKLKKAGATEEEINVFRKKSLDDFNQSQIKSTSLTKESTKSNDDLNNAIKEMSKVGLSDYSLAVQDITEKTQGWIKAGANYNEVIAKQKQLLEELNLQNSLSIASEQLSFLEKKAQLMTDEYEKSKLLLEIKTAQNIIDIQGRNIPIEDKQRLIEQENELYNLTKERIELDRNTEYQETMKNFQDDMLESQIKLNEAVYDFGSGFDGVGSKISKVSKSLAAMTNLELTNKKEVNKLDKKYEKEFTKYAGDVQKTKELEQQYTKDTALLNEANVINQINGYANIAGAMSGMFQEGSKEAALFAASESMLTMITATRAVANAAATGEPFTALANAAMMAASMSSLLSNVGIAFGMNKTTTSSDAFSSQSANEGKGSVLGETKKASESITKSLNTLEDFSQPQYDTLLSMDNYLANISNNIGGVAKILVQNSGYALGEGFTGFDSGTKNNVNLGSLLNPINSIISKIPVIGQINSMFGGALNSLAGGLLGKKSISTSLKDSGVNFADQLLSSAIKEFDGQMYQTVSTTVKKKSWFGSSSSTSINSYFKDMDNELENQFSMVLDGLYQTVLTAGLALDKSEKDTKKSLESFKVALGKISLKDKSGTEIQELLSNAFSKVGDDIAREMTNIYEPIYKVVGGLSNRRRIQVGTKLKDNTLDDFQRVGEGLFETLTRVATGMEEAEFYIDRLGKSFKDIKYTDIKDKQGNVGFEALLQSINNFEKNSNLYKIIKDLDLTSSELYQSYVKLDSLRLMLGYFGEGVNGLSKSMIQGAGGISELDNSFKSYLENFLTESERASYSIASLKKEFASIGKTMPTSIDGFKAMIKGIDTTTESGQKLYGRLIGLSEAFSDLFSSSDDNIKSFLDGFRTDKELLVNEAKNLGLKLATNAKDLKNQFTALSKDGLIDSELSYLEKMKDYLEKANDEALAKIENKVSIIKSTLESLDNVVNSLKENALGSEYGLNKFYESMKNTQKLLKGTDYEAIQKSIQETIGYSNALTNEANFTLTRDMKYAQLVAAKQFEDMGIKFKKDSDYLSSIQDNTKATTDSIDKMTSTLRSLFLGTPLPSFAVGTSYVSNDMTARIHQGEIITPKNFSDGLRNGDLVMGQTSSMITAINNMGVLVSQNVANLENKLNSIISLSNGQLNQLIDIRDINNESLVTLQNIEGII